MEADERTGFCQRDGGGLADAATGSGHQSGTASQIKLSLLERGHLGWGFQ